jgi:hypothetical protein
MIDQPAGAGPDGQWQSVHESPSAAACTTSNLATVDLQQLKEHVAQCIDSSLQMVEQELKLILHSPHSVVAQLAQKASSMGGKRLRPMLVLLSAQAASQSKTHVCSIDQDLLNIAVSVELVHAASLIHDDVMPLFCWAITFSPKPTRLPHPADRPSRLDASRQQRRSCARGNCGSNYRPGTGRSLRTNIMTCCSKKPLHCALLVADWALGKPGLTVNNKKPFIALDGI